MFFRTVLPGAAELLPGKSWDAVTGCGWSKLKISQLLKIKAQVLRVGLVKYHSVLFHLISSQFPILHWYHRAKEMLELRHELRVSHRLLRMGTHGKI